MEYSIQLKTDTAKSSQEYNCNDYDKADYTFKAFCKQAFELLGDLEVLWIQNNPEKKVIYSLIKKF